MAGLKFTKATFLKAAKGDKSWYHKDGFEPGAEAFLKSYYDDTVQNDALDLPLEDILALARSFWMSGDRRKVGTSFIRVEPIKDVSVFANKYDKVEIITDDRVFLVDSVIGEVSSHGIDILALYHPIVEGFRNVQGLWRKTGTKVRESMIQIIIPHQSAVNRRAIKSGLSATLKDLKIINNDFKPMIGIVEKEIEQLSASQTNVPADILNEAIAFLEWIKDGNFVLLGTRSYEYKKATKSGAAFIRPRMIKSSCYGILRDSKRLILRQSSEPATIASNLKAALLEKDPVTVAKSNLFSRIHRRVRMDYISIKHYNNRGKVKGETRIAGLFTVDAYSRPPMEVPLIRRKVDQVLHRFGAEPHTHNAKRLEFVLSSYPRDELFQSSEDDLFRIATGIARAYDRPRTRLFVRNDPYKRFVSVLVFVPRENYNTTVRKRIGAHLKQAWDGRVSAFYPQYSDSPLARVHFIIGLEPDNHKRPNLKKLEDEIAELSQPWTTGLLTKAEERSGPDLIDKLPQYATAFPPAYELAFSAEEALDDIAAMARLDQDTPLAVRVYRNDDDGDRVMRVKFFRRGGRLELSSIMPIFNNMGLHVAQETGYQVKIAPEDNSQNNIWIHDYEMVLAHTPVDYQVLSEIFEQGFLAIWQGENEDDAFNALILPQEVDWRRVAVLRLISRYRKQSGLDPSETVQIEALATYPEITALLLKLFEVKFDPSVKIAKEKRAERAREIEAKISRQMAKVSSLDHDRVLRRLANVLSAALRTNYYITDQQGRSQPFISLKIDSAKVEALPAPKPYREIFVWSPRVEGIHIRFGPVARGGLRWSDRRDDFRTEVLGLVKAQQVKNAVIVPVGSKGGFYPKKLPVDGGRDAFMAEGIAAYTQFVSGLLDITDTYKGRKTILPKNVICWDAPDPYLVVAADKGTATFSDIANGIAAKYGFWLDDAFASGGSVGYDHKAMGITAKGGWEAVKRHFREMGKNIQKEDFDVIGIGDMSGDVFGNGMLLSKHIRLLAAFDHRDIFIDPDPDAARSFKERQRLFNKARSSWQDYNTKLISKGGGVFSRTLKAIPLSPEIQKLTGLSEPEVTPNVLMNALLKSECELLWFGGIGTYIKARHQTHDDASDKANNPIRVNGDQIKAKVIGEGANLGVTQAGRIEFAKKGGRINTDAIDNSAGVDCSDNEVNIKILLSGAIEARELKAARRVQLLGDMTDEVASLVLQHNYDQTGSLSLAEKYARRDHHAYARFMDELEGRGKLDRDVEGLPDAALMLKMSEKGEALTRPELAVLNAYAKNVLFEDLIATNVADDKVFAAMLSAYFPTKVQGFQKSLKSHRLRREIIISRLVNRIVDVGGPVFMSRLSEQSNADVGELAKAFTIAYEVLQIEKIRQNISKLDNKVDADAQLSLMGEIALVLQRVMNWLVRHNEKGTIAQRIARRTDGLKHVNESWVDVLSTYDGRRVAARIGHFVRVGIPEDLAADVSLLRARASGFDVVELSEKTGWPIRKSAELFYDIGGRFKIDRLRSMSMKTPPKTHWEGLAQQRIEEDFYAAQAALALEAAKLHLKKGGSAKASSKTMITRYTEHKAAAVSAYENAYRKLNASGGWTLAKFAIINAQLRELLST